MTARSTKYKDKQNEDVPKNAFFPQSNKDNSVKTADQNDPRRFLHRQKSDFSPQELQELQQKLETWIQECRAARIFKKKGFRDATRLDSHDVRSDNEDFHGVEPSARREVVVGRLS